MFILFNGISLSVGGGKIGVPGGGRDLFARKHSKYVPVRDHVEDEPEEQRRPYLVSDGAKVAVIGKDKLPSILTSLYGCFHDANPLILWRHQ
jgi:hypothetical protein